jgi:hypothetical protein
VNNSVPLPHAYAAIVEAGYDACPRGWCSRIDR